MLTDGIAAGLPRRAATGSPRGTGVRAVLTSICDLRQATPYLFEVSGDDWLANHALGRRGVRAAGPDRPGEGFGPDACRWRTACRAS